MDGILRVLWAVFAALNVATGAPVDAENLPDRPAIVAPTINPNPVLFATITPLPAPSTAEVDGIISTIQDNIVIVNGQRITLVASTQVNGQLKVGAPLKAQVRVLTNGGLEADHLEVGDVPSAATDSVKPNGNPAQPTGKPEVKATETKWVENAQPSPTDNSQVKPTGQSEPQPQPQPTDKPEPQPQPQPTDKPETQPQPPPPPQPQPTEKPSGD